jgi:hypothetical protein
VTNTVDFDECGKVGVHRMLYYNKNREKENMEFIFPGKFKYSNACQREDNSVYSKKEAMGYEGQVA